MSDSDPIDAHRALQKAARELAHFADHGPDDQYFEAIERLETRLQVVRALTESDKSAEQQARDMLERCGVEDAQCFTSGDLVELANLVADAEQYRRQLAAIRHRCVDFTPDPSVVDEILAILGEDRRSRWLSS